MEVRTRTVGSPERRFAEEDAQQDPEAVFVVADAVEQIDAEGFQKP